MGILLLLCRVPHNNVFALTIKSLYFVASKFLGALAADGALDEEGLSTGELDRKYTPLREQVTASMQRQESVLANIQVLNDQII